MDAPDSRRLDHSQTSQQTVEAHSPLPTAEPSKVSNPTVGRRWGWWRKRWVWLWRVVRPAAARVPGPVVRWWLRRRAAQQLVLGFAGYVALGTLLLLLPFAQVKPAGFIDHVFTIVSAVSTTGLTTLSVRDTYSTFGQVVILAMFQMGGVGFMTISSLVIVARRRTLSASRLGVLKMGFSLPHYFVMQHFLRHVIVFTLAAEAVGALILWWRFAEAGVEQPLWSAVFHSVSAFATAGFSLNNNSLESFKNDWVVNLVIGGLSYLGAIGFIVVQDVWYSIKLRERLLTFTSKVILWMTGLVFVAGTALLYLVEPSVRGLPVAERWLVCAFQVCSASSTAGFNTVPIGVLSPAAIVVILVAMLIGASPSGTGGGIKTTSVSAILGNLLSTARGRADVVWLGHEIPLPRVLSAFAASSLYLIGLATGVLVLSMTERTGFLPLVFEAASAIGTVGLSMGITGELTWAGKVTVIVLMFVGRCGPLTIGLALLAPEPAQGARPSDDLAV